jgi:hypothetical protein
MTMKRWNGDEIKPWEQQTPDERVAMEEGRPQERAQREAAYDVLLYLHEYLFPEQYGGKPPKGTKKAYLEVIHHVMKVLDEAVYYHPRSQYPEG